MHKLSEGYNFYKRRTFIADVVKAAGATALLSIPETGQSAIPVAEKKEYTVQDVMDIILKEIPEAPLKQTVDTLKSGSLDQQVTGIVTTMFATVDIIKQAAKLKANFIIAHEPVFYNHLDDTNWVADNAVVKEKQHLLKQEEIAVWRFHDYWHTYRPDGIMHGVLKKTGWFKYYKDRETGLNIPATPLKKIIGHLKSSLGIAQVRVIGEPDQVCRKIALMPGASGGQRQVTVAQNNKPDLLIVGELQEWETAEYIRDARAFGSP
ncbi:MAG: NGG1p interacting factor 3 protein, partial [Chitinophagaceae bacterium]|nr:NGG1p interacting factor 3 protein [Chitinophagaceae bacterium]